MSRQKLDQIDVTILSVLQQDARTKRSELAQTVGLSVPSVSDRLRKLEEMGYILGYFTHLAPKKVCLDITAFIFIRSAAECYSSIIERACATEDILECHAITGDGSHLLKARARDTAHLEQLLADIQTWPGVQRTRTNIVLSSPKESSVLPLSHLTVE